jgi:hypothetical protein
MHAYVVLLYHGTRYTHTFVVLDVLNSVSVCVLVYGTTHTVCILKYNIIYCILILILVCSIYMWVHYYSTHTRVARVGQVCVSPPTPTKPARGSHQSKYKYVTPLHFGHV